MHKLLAEFIGTFSLVIAGCGAIVVNSQSGGALGQVGIAISFGLVIMAMIYATGHVSGAHFNPAVTLAFVFTRHLPWREATRYLLAQFLGAIAAAVVLRELFGDVARLGSTVPSGSDRQSFVLEFVMTFMVMFVITSVATDVRAMDQAAAIAIGGVIGLCAMFGGPISGASMNPARSLGPALISSTWDAQWIYLIAPVLGALVGAFAYQFTRGPLISEQSRPQSESFSDSSEVSPVA
jgi:aquaporin NIP